MSVSKVWSSRLAYALGQTNDVSVCVNSKHRGHVALACDSLSRVCVSTCCTVLVVWLQPMIVYFSQVCQGVHLVSA